MEILHIPVQAPVLHPQPFHLVIPRVFVLGLALVAEPRHGSLGNGNGSGSGSSSSVADVDVRGVDGVADAGGMAPAQMLVQVLQPREPLPEVALAAGMRAVQEVLGAAVLVVDLALMAQQAAGVRKTGELLAALPLAVVRAVVLIHVLVPLALPDELPRPVGAARNRALELPVLVLVYLATAGSRDQLRSRLPRVVFVELDPLRGAGWGWRAPLLGGRKGAKKAVRAGRRRVVDGSMSRVIVSHLLDEIESGWRERRGMRLGR